MSRSSNSMTVMLLNSQNQNFRCGELAIEACFYVQDHQHYQCLINALFKVNTSLLWLAGLGIATEDSTLRDSTPIVLNSNHLQARALETPLVKGYFFISASTWNW